MDNKVLFYLMAFALVILLVVAVSGLSEEDIIFPVDELGGCANEEECKLYCDDTENIEVCLDFAGKYELMPLEEIEEAKRVLPFLLDGTTPGGCRSEEDCDIYCDQEENLMECIEFAKEAGFISDEEYEIVIKTGGKGPGDCKREECQTYCDDDSHFEECIEFAKKYDLISDDDYEKVKKIGSFTGPGGCKKEECETYCDDDSHFEECIEFAHNHGFINDEDYSRVKKIGSFTGPGGCRKEECETYCDNPRNLKTCIEFARKHNLFEEEEFREKGRSEGAPEVCLDKLYGEDECKEYCESNREECWGDNEEYKESGRAEGVPEECLERNYGEEECGKFCEENPTECGWEVREGEPGFYSDGFGDVEDFEEKDFNEKREEKTRVERSPITGEYLRELDDTEFSIVDKFLIFIKKLI